jgi:hypothetical protein
MTTLQGNTRHKAHLRLVQSTATTKRAERALNRVEVFTAQDDTLRDLGICRGDEYAVRVGQFNPGDFHVSNMKRPRVERLDKRPADLVGRVIAEPKAPPAKTSYIFDGSLWLTYGLPEHVIFKTEAADEYRPGDLIAVAVKGVRLPFAVAKLRRLTRTRASFETDSGVRVYPRELVKIFGKVVECWQKLKDWQRPAACDDWPEYIDTEPTKCAS